jgi:alpha-beta hydrolase superfamily lysophospholipase
MKAVKYVLGAMLWMFVGAAAGIFTVYVLEARSLPPLQPWHHSVLGDDFGATNAVQSLEQYLAREAELFDRLEAAVGGRATGASGAVFDRYDASSPSNPANHPRNWNRTYEFETADPRGAVLLIHGLSDSPYSTRAVGEIFRARGFYVLGLRVPGHGTIPGALTATTWRDWSEAVRVGARHAADSIGRDKPLVLVGYSNGAALAVDYVAGILEGRQDPRPVALVLLSPAMTVHPVASLARFQRRLAVLPGLEKLAWSGIRPEYDPFKYSSFPVRAGEEIWRLTSGLSRRIAHLSKRGKLGSFPPVIAFQSVVDATIPPEGIVEGLLRELEPGGSELVLFDVNRHAPSGLFGGTGHDEFLRSLTDDPALPFGLTVVTNAAATSRSVIAKRRRWGKREWTETALDLEWPRMVYSLSHVAIPFPPDDPLYGTGETEAEPSLLNIGALAARGERGTLAMSTDVMMRLRYNPFYAYLAERVAVEIDRVAERPRRAATGP